MKDACIYCGDTEGPFHMDHVVPRSRGGPDLPDNLAKACARCNSEKSDLLPSEWIGDSCPKRALEIERRISARVEVKVRSARGPKTWAGAVVAPGFLLWVSSPCGYVNWAGRVVAIDGDAVRLRCDRPTVGYGPKRIDMDEVVNLAANTIRFVATPEHSADDFWNRVAAHESSLYMPNPFSRRLELMGHLETHKQAAVNVHDTMETADVIAKSVFRGRWSIAVTFRVYAELLKEEAKLTADAERSWNRETADEHAEEYPQ